MTKEEIRNMLETEDEDKELVFEVCRIASASDSERIAEKLLSTANTTEDVFTAAYRFVNRYEDYGCLKTKALFKLLYMMDKRSVGSQKSSLYRVRRKVTVLRDVIEYAWACFGMHDLEKLLIFKIDPDSYCSAVYESDGKLLDFCYMNLDELYSVLKENSENAFVIIHSHPFGDSTPSEADIYIHSDIKKLFAISNSTLIEHVILSQGNGKINCHFLEHSAEYYEDVRIIDMIPKKIKTAEN